MKKKIIAVLLACMLTAGLTVSPAGMTTVQARDWQEQTTEYGFVYKEDGDGIIITGCDNTNDAEIVIPERIDGKKVTEIGESAFYQLSNIKSVHIPDGVKSIGSSAFAFCTSLTDIRIPESVTEIGGYAFTQTPWQEEQFKQNGGLAIVNHILIAAEEGISGDVTIPDGVTGIGEDLFYNCSGLTGINIPKSVTSIGKSSFTQCENLTDLHLPDNITEIGPDAFAFCSGLTGITIPDGVTSIGEGAFWGCGLTDVRIPQSVAGIGGQAFGYTPWMDEQLEQNDGMVIINQNLIYADDGYFSDYTVVIPDGVISIGRMAFNECSDMTEIRIPESVTEIGPHAFTWCSSLEHIDIPDGVTRIGTSAFYGCSGLTGIHLPESITEIEADVFQFCSGLSEIRLPSGITDIGGGAFFGCESLTDVDIPDSVKSIGGNAFSWCESLTGVNIPGSVKYIGSSAFENTPWLREQMKQNGGLEIVNQTVVDADENISGTIEIPSGVTRIGEGAFSDCKRLSGVRIPSGVTAIGEGAFSGCSGLRSTVMPASLNVIGDIAFSGCSSLIDIRIPEGVTEIGEGAFAGCESLIAIAIPASVKKIGGGLTLSAFSSAPKDVYYGGSREEWNRIWFIKYNVILNSAAFHFHSAGPADLGLGIKKPQNITANDITKTYGANTFSIGAVSDDDAALSYAVSNPKVAAVDGGGIVTIKGYGITDITITAAETNAYEKTQKTIRLTVKPKQMKAASVKSKKKKTATVKWKKDKKASGYLIECATDKKFKKNRVKTEIRKNKTVTATIKKLKSGKKYYVRICAYAKSGGLKVQGDWSKTKTVKVKK